MVHGKEVNAKKPDAKELGQRLGQVIHESFHPCICCDWTVQQWTD